MATVESFAEARASLERTGECPVLASTVGARDWNPEAALASVIAPIPEWTQPVVPVCAGATGWDFIEDGAFHRWCAEAGVVVLKVWDQSEPEMLAEMADDLGSEPDDYRLESDIIAPGHAMEVRLPVAEHLGLLAELLAKGGGTLAVLEFRGGVDEPPVWGSMELHALALKRIIGAALRLEKLGQ